MVQQVIANISWAIKEDRIPIVVFGDRCIYWTPKGFQGKYSVWEYYFEPLVPKHSAESIPPELLERIQNNPPSHTTKGYSIDPETFVSNHFGDHPKLKHKALQIPYKWKDPDNEIRLEACAIIQQYVRPRTYILEKVEEFYKANFEGYTIIGVHIRGTDAISEKQTGPFRKGMLSLNNYVKEINAVLKTHPRAKIFVATDDESSLESIKAVFGDRVIAYDSFRHRQGEAAGQGPKGWLMPAYISSDRDLAAQNGMEAVIECLLLTRSSILLHNGSSLASFALLTRADLPHVNTYRPDKLSAYISAYVKGFSMRMIFNDIRRRLFALMESDEPPTLQK